MTGYKFVLVDSPLKHLISFKIKVSVSIKKAWIIGLTYVRTPAKNDLRYSLHEGIKIY